MARLHVESGWVPEGTNLHAFEGVIRSACEPVFEKPLAEISFGTLLIYLFQAARRFGMEVQPSLVLLQKTLLNIEGLGRQLYPELDLWQTAHPFLEQWMAKRYSPQRMLNELKNQSPALLEALPALPNLILKQLHNQTAGGQLSTPHKQAQLDRIEGAMRSQGKINTAIIVIATISILLSLSVAIVTLSVNGHLALN
jgi:ubiquinone biosynthesis protein